MNSATRWQNKIKSMAVKDKKLKEGEKSINILKLTVMISTYKAAETRDEEKREAQRNRNRYILLHSPA
jgi:Tfp pilus assembly protein PilO